MALLDWLPCCGARRKQDKDAESTAESATLLPPPRDASILSLEAGYGAVDTASIGAGASNGGLSGEQRARIEEIGREVGSQMLPIHGTIQRSSHPSPLSRPADPSVAPSTSSASSSRPSSPSPLRPETSPPGGTMRTPEPAESAGAAGDDSEGVVRKTVFLGGLTAGAGGPRKSSAGRGRGKGRGRGRGK
ncbi:hypothetical protein JCM24511_04187 [Saitozyma sp. JCM 24511]|uniref:Uncharacterized protein n=1 Tax=Saitozyma podzolica TaxID=1890683 RepID=A0A427YDF9_9TREE|nr:hypothetical protein EHS25_002759 [Saitozyma podzolica]GFZ46961.1 hypothetical protein JCM24511_04187 [Saitozyma sp. JCM 24511]